MQSCAHCPSDNGREGAAKSLSELPVWISLINKRLLGVLLKHPKRDILEIHLMVSCKGFLH